MLKLFTCFGFSLIGSNDTQYYGVCPFCRDRHHKHRYTFYINKENFLWDCKSCGLSGNTKIFLKEIYKKSFQNIEKNDYFLNILAKERGIDVDILKDAKIGYLNDLQMYIIPYFDEEGNFLSFKHFSYKDKKLKTPSFTHLNLYNLWEYDDSNNIVYLCEGEWDTLALKNLRKYKNFQGNILGVPGANIFKPAWVKFIRDKIVYVLFDNDEAGVRGVERLFKLFNSYFREFWSLQWDKDLKKGYDIRDLWKDKRVKSLKYIRNHLNPSQSSKYDVIIKNKLEPISYKEVIRTYKKWLLLKDTKIIPLLFGTVFANRLEGNPVWLMLIGSPGSTKSELLLSFSFAKEIVTTSLLTAHTLISGQKDIGGVDPSLLAILHKKVLIIKDLTPLLDLSRDELVSILGVLRDAYDGKIEKRFGNGIYRKYEPCQFGIIAGCTFAIEHNLNSQVSLGERFLKYKIRYKGENDCRDVLDKVFENVNVVVQMKKELGECVKRVLDTNKDITPIEFNKEVLEKIKNLAIFTAELRNYPPKDRYKGYYISIPPPELPTRLAISLHKMLQGICIFKGKNDATEKELNILKKIAFDCLNDNTCKVLNYLVKCRKEMISIPTCVNYTNLPISIVTEEMERLKYLGFLNSSLTRTTEKFDVIVKEDLFYDC